MAYVQPVNGQVKRLDQGIDYQGNPGDPVVAIGLARVDYVKDDPGGFGKVVYYTLLDGPARGKQIYVGHAAPAALLLQNGHLDTTFVEQDAKDLYQAAGDPKEIRWYDADHNLNEQARQDRAEWLQRQLGAQ